jgi:2-oxoglutarate dehydrogenase E2 component (dihydrolipoamide succinyltransferase)
MAQYELLLPKMGESVAEATIIKWEKNPGDYIEVDDTILEVATDKVDSEIPSPVKGKLIKQLFGENDVAQIGDVIAILEIEGETVTKNIEISENKISQEIEETETIPYIPEEITSENKSLDFKESSRFYSPLVKSIAQEEGIALQELDKIIGTGAEGRVTKADLLNYVESNKKKDKSLFVSKPFVENIEEEVIDYQQKVINVPVKPISSVSIQPGDEVIEMDRMRKLIADHMISSTQISAHVTSFVEADVTNLVQWRNKVKNNFEKREKEKITFTPIFIEAVAKAIKDLPMINISVNGSQIIKKRDINIGMAAALPNGNLIVPVIKNADQLNMVGLTKSVNDLANRARNNKLQPDEIQGGTFTITNIGGFGNIMGTPIINQPQVAILAVGVIKKKPAVIETEHGDMIGIRHMMYLSLSYDHRVVDGALGGMFVKKVADYLEQWDVNREI